MIKNERVVESLNHALHALFAADPHVFLLGADMADPYGGAFKATKGLSTRYPDRVLSTPLSEAALLGIGGGLALCGEKPLIEFMFGDFITLGFDQLLNFATKSVTMYGRTIPMNLVVRCPVGANRAYGPTHSQSLHKHFIGIPHLSLFELSPFLDITALLHRLVNLGHPCILFEDKVLYTERVYHDGYIDDLFRYAFLDRQQSMVRVFSESFDSLDCLVIAPGGLIARCLAAARQWFIDLEIGTQLVIPAQLYPFEIEPLLDLLTTARQIVIVEESVAGGTWGCEVAQQIYDRLWGRIRQPICLVHSRASIIPSAAHLEQRVIVQKEDIYHSVVQAIGKT